MTICASRRGRLPSALLLATLCAASARECGQQEIKARDISGCKSLKHVKYIGKENAQWLGDALHHNVDLKFLDLHHTKIGDEDAKALAAGLRNNTHLRRLHLHNNRIYDEGIIALGHALLENDALEFLSLSSNGCKSAGAKGLAEGLKGNKGLRMLDLYFNMVGDAGAVALADALRVNRGLRILKLDSNQIGNEGGLALAKAIRGDGGGVLSVGSGAPPSALGHLGLAYNQLENSAAKALLAAAKHNPTIHYLNVHQNHAVQGDVKEENEKVHYHAMDKRAKIAQWLVENDLIEGGYHSAVGPPLATEFAPAVTALKAYNHKGLLELRHMGAKELAAHAAMKGLPTDRRDVLIAKLLENIAKVTAHDEV